MSTAAMAAIELLKEEGPSHLSTLKENAQYIHSQLSQQGCLVTSEDISPIVHIGLAASSSEDPDVVLRRVAKEVRAQKVFVTVAHNIQTHKSTPPPPSIKLYVHANHSRKDLDNAIKAIVAGFSKANM